MFDAFPVKCLGCPFSAEGIRYYRSLKNVRATLEPENYPMLVWFKDTNDPKTVQRLLDVEIYDAPGNKASESWPGKKGRINSDEFEPAFGAGVTLKDVTIEMTDDPPTLGGIQDRLPWLKEITGYISGKSDSFSADLFNSLDKGDFVKGEKL